MKDYLTPLEAAKRLGISRNRLYQLLKEHRIMGARRYAGLWRIPVDMEITIGRTGPRPAWLDRVGVRITLVGGLG